MRSVGSEILSVSLALAIPMGVALVFPYEAIGFRAAPGASVGEPFAAFVHLTADEEAKALQTARMRLKYESSELSSSFRANLFSVGELKVEDGDILREDARTRPAGLTVEPYRPGAFVPSRRAAPVSALPVAEATKESPVFAREELLEIK